MKVCILSMQRVANFGSLLQSYALKRELEKLGHTVSFLDIEKNEQDYELLYPDGEPSSQQQSKLRSVANKLKKLDRYALNRLRIKKMANRQDALFARFCEDALGANNEANKQNYDYCVIGSDEVFNCLTKSSWGFTSQLFGNVPQADQVITYAASCGATKLNELPPAVAQRISEVFTTVKAFSVRDENTRAFVAALAQKDIFLHADPVMISDFTEEIETTAMPKGVPERYCVVYSYYNRISDPVEIAQIKAFCKENDLVPITVGAPQMWIGNHLALTPMEALKVLRNAQFIFTDTFHGTIFSSKYAKAFAVMTRPSNENKLGDLLRRFGLEKHKVTAFGQVDSIQKFTTDPEALAVPIKEQREKTLEYLKTMIQ